MPTYYSTTVASSQGTAFDNQFRAPVGLQHGRIRVATGTVASVSSSFDTADGDVLVLATLRGTDRLVAEVTFGDGGEDTSSQIFDVGLYKKASDGSLGAVADADCFDVDSAVGVTAGINFGSVTENHIGKPMWEIAGAASEDAGEAEYFLAITTDGSNGTFDAANFRFGASVYYTAGD